MSGRQRLDDLTTCLALCMFVAALSGGCKSTYPRTQVMLVIEADDEVRARATELGVTFESRSEFDHIDGTPYTETFSTTEGSMPYWPYSVALLPRDNDTRRSYRIVATLYEGETAIAELRARSGFIAQRTLELQLLFTADCLEKSLDCSEQETCFGGACLSSDVDVLSLSALGGTGPGADGAIPNSSEVRTGAQTRMGGGTAGAGGKSPGQHGAGGASGGDAADGGTMTDKPVRIIGGNCGDGVWNDEEECDTAIAQGKPGACPESCSATDSCKPLQREGAACKTRCMEYPIQTATADDGCCLPGTDPGTDPDCAMVATCGNGVVEMGELCDGDTCPTDPAACPRSNECQRPMIVGDAASCSARCVMLAIEVCVTGDGCCGTSGCTNATDAECSPSCGNGIVEDAFGETCEPTSTDQTCPSCNDGDPCTDDITTGTPENCNVRCDHEPVTRTVNGDMCCPAGRGNANNDTDCPAMCGNSVIERGEFCDGNCPTGANQCEDFIPCTRGVLVASPCGMRCNFEPILGAANGDMCCPFGANAMSDNDCAPSCGNLVVERGEMCDGNCPTSCPADTDNNACTVNVVVSTGCQRRCESRPVAANTNGPDGCCPSGATSSTDSDCRPMCTGSEMLCGDRCVQLNTNAHCARCDDACVAPTTCMAGTCQAPDPSCGDGESLCGGSVCVSLDTPTHCGRCGNSCGAQACTRGLCDCPSGTERCGDQCVATNTVEHCGSCSPCPTGQMCAAGTCQIPACPTGTERCGGECIVTNTDDHCGSCSPCPTGQMCAAGTCQIPACPSGTERCGGQCVATNTNANCGSCGNDCRGALTCLGSSCGCASGSPCGTACCGSGQTCSGGSCQDPDPPPVEPMP
ncbi:MAG TPA: hypothetical protein VFN67_10600 [Polyangiales bacterium]|nr:hypothetical protein [Polyangiales bacterium]